MDFLEKAFAKTWSFVRSRQSENSEIVQTEQVAYEIELVLCALFNRKIKIFCSENSGFLDGAVLRLPLESGNYPNKDLNKKALVHLAVFLVWSRQHGYKIKKIIRPGEYEHRQISNQLLSAELKEKWRQEFPSLQMDLAQQNESLLFGLAALPDRNSEVGKLNSSEADQDESLTKRTYQLRKNRKPKFLKLNQDSENPLVHFFEKLLTIDSYRGGERKIDDDNNDEDMSEALREVELEYLIRTDRASHNSSSGDGISAEIRKDEEVHELAKHIYPEWNAKEKILREHWCELFESTPQNSEVTFDYDFDKNKNLRMQLEQMMVSKLTDKGWRRRQKSGQEYNLEVLVDQFVDQKRGVPKESRHFDEYRKLHSDISVLLIIDSSMSSDCEAGDKKLIEIYKESALELLEFMPSHLAKFEIADFNSMTRSLCRFNWCFNDKVNLLSARSRLGQLIPQGYTRIGAVLRHATQHAIQYKSKTKKIILLTDSKPSDYDTYEGQYGVQDVAHAVESARVQGLDVLVYCHEQFKNEMLKEMYGQDGFTFFKDVPELLQKIIFDVLKP